MKRQLARTFTLVVLIMLVLVLPEVPIGALSQQAAVEADPALTSANRDELVALPSAATSALGVILRAASGAAIPFQTQNGETDEGMTPQKLDLPHLVLTRNGALTDSVERTLMVEVAGIQVPPAGATVTLEIETQHGSPDKGEGLKKRIPVWRESQFLANRSGTTLTGVTARFALQFGETVVWGAETLATPTDYFYTRITVVDAAQPQAEPLHVWDGEHAFLMESQWIAPLPAVPEESAGAAPDELIVYYCDMFPFWKSIADPSSWLPREEVTDYVGRELVPALVEAFRVQSAEWGFVWYEAWSSYRLGADAKRLSVALTTPDTWFHGEAPRRANSKISIRVKGGDNADYDTLTDGIMSSFHHELFHNLQRSINLHQGGDGNVAGAYGAWSIFAEGMAVFASSVGQAGVQFAPSPEERAYVYRANRFLSQVGDGQVASDPDWAEQNPYDAAIYWRFLYEQCGGMQGGVEDPAAGMQIIERTLKVLYSSEVVDISASTDLARGMPRIMDQALQGSACSFQTYAESLEAFARAVDALRLDGGRCVKPGLPNGCGFYDPAGLYVVP
jgi:hypothetical protein